MNLEQFLNYDILCIICDYLSIDELLNLLSLSKKINQFKHSNLIIKKIINHFTNLKLIYFSPIKNDTNVHYIITNIYKMFKYHPTTFMSDFITFLIDFKVKNYELFEIFISNCYYNKYNIYIWNSLNTSEIMYFYRFGNKYEIELINKYIKSESTEINLQTLIKMDSIRFS
jgi:hypothetical protein